MPPSDIDLAKDGNASTVERPAVVEQTDEHTFTEQTNSISAASPIIGFCERAFIEQFLRVGLRPVALQEQILHVRRDLQFFDGLNDSTSGQLKSYDFLNLRSQQAIGSSEFSEPHARFILLHLTRCQILNLTSIANRFSTVEGSTRLQSLVGGLQRISDILVSQFGQGENNCRPAHAARCGIKRDRCSEDCQQSKRIHILADSTTTPSLHQKEVNKTLHWSQPELQRLRDLMTRVPALAWTEVAREMERSTADCQAKWEAITPLVAEEVHVFCDTFIPTAIQEWTEEETQMLQSLLALPERPSWKIIAQKVGRGKAACQCKASKSRMDPRLAVTPLAGNALQSFEKYTRPRRVDEPERNKAQRRLFYCGCDCKDNYKTDRRRLMKNHLLKAHGIQCCDDDAPTKTAFWIQHTRPHKLDEPEKTKSRARILYCGHDCKDNYRTYSSDMFGTHLLKAHGIQTDQTPKQESEKDVMDKVRQYTRPYKLDEPESNDHSTRIIYCGCDCKDNYRTTSSKGFRMHLLKVHKIQV